MKGKEQGGSAKAPAKRRSAAAGPAAANNGPRGDSNMPQVIKSRPARSLRTRLPALIAPQEGFGHDSPG